MAVVTYVFGAPGSGKTTYLAKIAHKECKHRKVYCNFPLDGTILIQDKDIGYYNFKNSLIILDEAGITYNNRDAFKKDGMMKDESRIQYWKLVRHYHTQVIIASQGYSDVDLKVRMLATDYRLIKKSIIPFCSVVKPIVKKCDIDDTTHEPTDFYMFLPFWNWKIVFRPKYYKYFDSYDAPELPDYYTDRQQIIGTNKQHKLLKYIRKYISERKQRKNDKSNSRALFFP